MVKIKMLVAMVAMLTMLLVTAAPAMAHHGYGWGWGDDFSSGDLDQELSYSVKGNNNNVCGSPVQIGNTGNVNNPQNVGGLGNSVRGGYIEQSPIVSTRCDQR